MSKFRGQYMDMVHPSSDVKVADKPNFASERPVKAPSPMISSEPDEEVLVDDEIIETIETPEVDDDTYQSPFLPDVEVEKRPLGGSPAENTKQFFGIYDENSPFDINEHIDLSKPELPADDGGKGELEPELPSGEEEVEVASEPEPDPEISKEVFKPFEPATRAAVVNTMIPPQYKTSETTKLDKPNSPFEHASDAASPNPARKSISIWVWIILFIGIAAIGAVAGWLIYLMMG
ncbi:MAG: vitamin K epoxide reductase family protein [Candidatus Nomurabacteria bacterium]|jgi:hypothetical protein|nr:vitamin K epoxide reductase family protein [Candidatus Nomurabacteria bacterium]